MTDLERYAPSDGGESSLNESIEALVSDLERVTAERDDALDEAKSADLHRNLNRRVAAALGLLDERVDAESGEAYLPSWHDMPEQVTALRAEVGRLTAERDAYRRTLDKEGAANAFAQDSLRGEIDMLRRERHAERLLVQERTAEIAELRLTLAAEQGRAEGAPSEGWTFGEDCYRKRRWSKGTAECIYGQNGWKWRVGRKRFQPASSARTAMFAAKETP